MKENIETLAVDISKTGIIVLYAASFAIPFLIGTPQLLVGTVVNAILILSAIKMKRSRLLYPLLFIPSIATIARGLVFGPFTPLLFYMLPFIWASNGLLVFVLQATYVNKSMNYFLSLFLASLVKTIPLFLTASIYVSLKILPTIFLTGMGLVQFITASLGGIAVIVLLKLKPVSR